MKKMPMLLTIGGILLVGAIAYTTVQLVAKRYLSADDQQAVAACSTHAEQRKITISDNSFQPAHTTAHLCSTLTITNLDDTLRKIAFGQHNKHRAYDGITEKVLKKGESFTVTLNRTGTFTLHDHLHETVAGSFTVAK